jgi:hypothetical protein
MRRGIATGLPLGGLTLLLSVAGAGSLRGQDPRDACLAQAFKEFDPGHRQQLLMCALNPSAGSPRGAWPLGVQLLAQTLIEDGKDSIASVWLRWAVRLSPELQPDTERFLPRVVAAYRGARDFVSRTRSSWDTAVATTWSWPAQDAAQAQGPGRIQVNTSATAPARVFVQGVGLLGPGASAPVAPGSYAVSASAAGYDSARVTREVMPGVTTLLDFHLRAVAQLAGAGQPAAQPTETPNLSATTPPAHQGGIPTWAKVGVAGGVAWAILWNAYIKSH